jgi:predicted molibdopterin-dependent oxidoreductase YjgC
VNFKEVLQNSGGNISRKMCEDKIRAAFILGENPASAVDYNQFVQKLEFLVVADMYLTETAQSADVFLPLSSYLESEGHFTNWSGMRQEVTLIGIPANGMTTQAILKRLSSELGIILNLNGSQSITDELESFISTFAICERNNRFATPDGKAHFTLYPAQVQATSANVPSVLEIDARISAQMKLVRG